EAVWRETAVTDDSLVQCLKDIRRALNDDTQQIIKTVPRRGYIFEKDIRETGNPSYSEETTGLRLVIEETIEEIIGQPQSAIGRKFSGITGTVGRHKTAAVVVSAIVLITVVAAGVILGKPVLAWWFKPSSIAILPIVNASGDANLDYISDGLTESIITSLARLNTPGKIPRLRVFAQNTMFIFKNKGLEPRNVGRELGADSVLVSKMFAQNALRIFKFELINVADGSVAWSRQYAVEPNLPAIFLETQNQIPNDVAAQLRLGLSDADRQILTRRYTQNAEAYDLYLKGRAESRRVTPSSLLKSVEYFQKAIDLDPDFATAYWATGMSYRIQGETDERSDKEATEKAVDMFQKALKIDSNLEPAQNALKKCDGADWNWKAIEKEGPTHPAWDDYLAAMGRIDEQIKIDKNLLSVVPYNPKLNFRYCNSLLMARRPDEAIAQAQKMLALVTGPDKPNFNPEFPWTHLFFALAYSQKGMLTEAINEMKMAVELAENSKTLNAELAAIYAQAGQRDEAFKILEQLRVRESGGEYAPSLNIALVYCNLGDKEQAYKWLDKAFDERETRLPWVRTRPDCDFLYGEPRFAELVRRIGLPN
ncbi:MAG: tetratricopeptide repeat protein, partial [Pyrinomonadaceae bacterium]